MEVMAIKRLHGVFGTESGGTKGKTFMRGSKYDADTIGDNAVVRSRNGKHEAYFMTVSVFKEYFREVKR